MNWQDYRPFWPNADISRFARVGPHRWHLQDAGQGPCVLLLHGAGASTHTWRDILPDLARDHRVVAIDLPGQGFTTPCDAHRCDLEAISADIAALLSAEAVEPAMIVGHSAGAAIALRLALDLPRPPGAVVAINGALRNHDRPGSEILSQLTRLVALTPVPAAGIAWLASSPGMVRRMIQRTGSTLDERGVEFYRRLLSDRRHVAGTVDMMAQWDISSLLPDLPRLSARVLFLVGDGDLAVPPDVSEATARLIAGARVVARPGLGHLMHEERPSEAAAAIRDFGARDAGFAELIPRKVS